MEGLARRSGDFGGIEEEVAAESTGRISLAGKDPALTRAVLACLRGDPPLPPGEEIAREGIFTLVQLPGEAPGRWETEDLMAETSAAELVLYCVDAATGWLPEDRHWLGRLRAASVPILPVEVAPSPATGPGDEEGPGPDAGLPPSLQPVRLAACEAAGAETLLPLVSRMLALRPRLAIPLAAEAPACRAYISQRVIRSNSLLAGLLGIEPVPLIDLPLRVAITWRMALQLAAVHGRPGPDYASREMAVAVAVNLTVAYTAQLGLRSVPVAGWIAGGLLSGAATWLLGQLMARAYASAGHGSPDLRGPRLGAHLRLGARLRRIAPWRKRRPGGWPAAAGTKAGMGQPGPADPTPAPPSGRLGARLRRITPRWKRRPGPAGSLLPGEAAASPGLPIATAEGDAPASHTAPGREPHGAAAGGAS